MMSAATVFGWLFGPVGRYVAGGLAILAIASTIYGRGHAAATRKCETAGLRGRIAILQADIGIARKAAADEAQRAKSLEQSEKQLTEKADALRAELEKRPGACRIGPDDARRLRGL